MVNTQPPFLYWLGDSFIEALGSIYRCRMDVENQEKCIRQFARNVNKNVKFRSNLTKADLYIVENVILVEDPREEVDTKLPS